MVRKVAMMGSPTPNCFSPYDILEDFIIYYNERQLHWLLDMDNRQTSLKVFHDKAADESIKIPIRTGWG